MGYRQALITRLDRRDRLAILVIALAVTVVTAGIILTMGMGSHATGLTGDFEPDVAVDRYDDASAAHADASEEAVVVPYHETTVNGEQAIVAGVPAEEPLPGASAFEPPHTEGPEVLTPHGTDAVVIGGEEIDATAQRPDAGAADPFPHTWYLTTPEQVERLADTDPQALVLDAPREDATSVAPGLFAYVNAGVDSLLGVLWVATLAAGLLVAVVAFAVVRMTIADRKRTLGIIRATGAGPVSLGLVLLGRVALVAGIGVALGFAVGVVLPNGLLRVANIAGWATALPTTITFDVARTLLVALGTLFLVALLAGGLAMLSVLRDPPAAVIRQAPRIARSPRDPSSQRLFGLETAAVTVASVAVFVLFALVIVGATGAAAPLGADEGATLTESGAAHPINSQVDVAVAAGATAQGIEASPEILAFGVIDGEPVLIRGVEYDAYAEVRSASIQAGDPPTSHDEVLLGTSVARQLDVEPGDSFVMGGSTRTEVAPVTVSGTYEASGYHGDQVLVPLPMARQFTGLADEQVHLVRFTETLEEDETAEPSVVVEDIPETALAGDPIPVTIRLTNPSGEPVEENVQVDVDGQAEDVTLTVPAHGMIEETIELPAQPEGQAHVTIDNVTTEVDIRDPEAIEVAWTPATAPPNASVSLSVTYANGTPAAGVPVSHGDVDQQTDTNGTVHLDLPDEPGSVNISVEADERTIEEAITMDPDAERALRTSLQVDPEQPAIEDAITVSGTVENPWEEPVERTIVVAVSDREAFETRTIPGRDSTQVELAIGHQSPGTYDAELRIDGAVDDTTTYTVQGDETLAGVAAGHGDLDGGTGMGQAVSWLLGDLRVVMGTLLIVAGATTVAGTATVFQRGVHARRRSLGIRRATGASPRSVLWDVLVDAGWIALPAVAVAIGAGTLVLLGAEAMGWLTAFGVSLRVIPDGFTMAWIWLGGIAVSLVGAGMAGYVVTRGTPARLFRRP